MKKISLFILIPFYFFSVNAQQLSYSGYTDIFKSPENIDQKSDTSFTITHSLTQTIDVSTSVSCIPEADGIHSEYSYYRVFDLSGYFNLNGDWSVQTVEIGIGLAESGTGTTQPALLRLWTMSEYDGNTIKLDSLTFKPDSVFFNINNNESGTIKNVLVEPAISIPHGTVLVVEVLIPSRKENNHKLYLGSNSDGQTDNTYIRAPDCDVSNPINIEEILFGDMMLVLNINGAYDAATPEILSFSVNGQLTETEIINKPDYVINVVMPTETDLTSLTPEITVPLGFYISPKSGVTVDFSSGPVEYVVTNEYSKISQSWFADVTNAGPDIIDIQISDQNDITIIDNDNKSAIVSVPLGTGLTDITPNITIYNGFTINPESGVSQDFSLGPVLYTVSHETLPLTQDWQLTVIESIGTKVNLLKNDIKIFPNPASNFVSVSGADIIKVDIVNSLGMHVFSTDEKIINTSKLPTGIYFLKIHTKDEMILKKILILK